MNLKELLDGLSKASTPGSWNPDPMRLTMPLRNGRVAEGPLMSYLIGSKTSTPGTVVSLGSERVADHRFVAALVNAYRDGELAVVEEELPLDPTHDMLKALAGDPVLLAASDEEELRLRYLAMLRVWRSDGTKFPSTESE